MRKFFAGIVLIFALGVFLGLGAYQLHLPGLHYDEAKEAGLNAMELLTGQPLTAFRDATVQIGRLRLPLMVQDYIGDLNVLLAVPFLAVGGINTVALRWLPLLIAALTLVITWRVAHRLGGPAAAAATALLLAVNPTFIFWSRQGIFVTNLTALLLVASLLAGLRWWQSRRAADLWLVAVLWGLGLYAKLLFAWAIGAMVGLAAIVWLLEVRRWKVEGARLKGMHFIFGAGKHPERVYSSKTVTAKDQSKDAPLTSAPNVKCTRLKVEGGSCKVEGARRGQEFRSGEPVVGSRELGAGGPRRALTSTSALTLAFAAVFLLVPLTPLIVFNIRTGGTLTTIFGNLGRSYYGVDNSAYLANLQTRLQQVLAVVRGDFFWYLGEMFANAAAPWLLLGLVALAAAAWGLWMHRERGGGSELLRFLVPLGLLALIIAQSAFTVSDLFITHYALVAPLLPLAGGLAVGSVWEASRSAARHGRTDVFSREGSETQSRKAAEAQSSVSGFAVSGFDVGSRRDLATSFLRGAALLVLLAWVGTDLWTTLRYHAVLAVSGGIGGHSDAIYPLAEHLDRAGGSASVALDWGLDAPVRFLTADRVRPVEVFGYEGLEQPDLGFDGRVGPFLDQPGTLYLAHAPDKTIFKGRVEALAALAAARGLTLVADARFTERSGNPVLVVYRVEKPAR